jgi:enoyl-CoA hydratase/carnithine racemase
MSRHRALEVVLTDDVLDAAASAAYGWINQAVPSHALDAHVTDIARHTAALPDCVIAAAEQALPVEDITEGLLRETDAWPTRSACPLSSS